MGKKKKPQGFVDRIKGYRDHIRLEILGALDDLARSFEQVFNAFTLQEEDIQQVMGRIDKAKRQLIWCIDASNGSTTEYGSTPADEAAPASLAPAYAHPEPRKKKHHGRKQQARRDIDTSSCSTESSAPSEEAVASIVPPFKKATWYKQLKQRKQKHGRKQRASK